MTAMAATDASLAAGLRRAQRHNPDTVQADEFAGRLGVSTWALYESVKRGDCPVTPIKVGRRLVWPKAAVDRLLGLAPEESEAPGTTRGDLATSSTLASAINPSTNRGRHGSE